jgi:Ca2+-binding EF-hand superfamily protein
LSCKEALEHPWLVQASDEPLDPAVKAGLSTFVQDTKLKRALARLNRGALTDSDKENLQSLFKDLDRNNDGVLDIAELVAIPERLGFNVSKSRRLAEDMISEFDLDKNGGIDLEEFAVIKTRGKLEIDESFVLQLFNEIDRDGNKVVTQDEIELYFAEHPDIGVEVEVDVLDLMNEADLNNDGVISFAEFLDAMQTKKSKQK